MGYRWGAAFVRIGWQASFGLGGSFAPDWVAGITGIHTLEWKNTLRDRCSHISGLVVKAFHALRALMKSALPRLINSAASKALGLSRVWGSRSDLSCHQLDHTSHRAEGLFDLSVK